MGQLIPEFSLGEAFAPWVEPVFANGIMYTGYSDFSIRAVDIAAKKGIWRFPANGRITSPVIDEGVVVFGSTDKHAYALDASTGQEIRRFKAGAQIRFSPAVRDGSVCISAGRTQIHCLDILSGRRKWSVRTDTPITGRPFRYDDSVFQFDEWRRLYCYDANTGEFRWTANTPRLDAHGLIQVGDILVMPQKSWWSLHLSYYGRKERDGCRILDFNTEDPVTGEETESLVAFQIMTGSVAWVIPMPGSIRQLFSADGVIYGSCHRADETAIFAIEGETGRELWMIGLKPLDYGRVLAHDGRIYYLECDGDLYSVLRP